MILHLSLGVRITSRALRRHHRSIRKKIVQGISKHKTTSSVVSLYILSNIFSIISGAFGNVLTDLNEYLLDPYRWIATWSPSSGIGKWVHFNFLFWPCVGVLLLVIRLGNFIWNNWIAKIEEEPVTPLVLYKEEVAAAAEAMDFSVNAGEKEEAFEDLLLTVTETIAVNLGLRRKEYRMMFFTEKPGQVEIAGYRVGKQHELVIRGKLDPASFYPRDLDLIRMCLQQEETELVVPNISFSDAKVVLFTRNPGRFRLGLFIAILKDYDVKVAEEVFPQVAHIITTLGFMDEIRSFIVEYD